MMMMTGFGLLTAAIPLPEASAAGPYLFEDNFDGPAGSAPDPKKWEIAQARESMEDPTFWELPENVGQYRDDRRNVYLDGKSNLVFHAAKDGKTYYSGKVFGKFRGGIGHHLGSPDQAELPDPRRVARLVPGQQQPRQRRRSRHHGVVRQRQLGRREPPSTPS